jgi:hypothetical protein
VTREKHKHREEPSIETCSDFLKPFLSYSTLSEDESRRSFLPPKTIINGSYKREIYESAKFITLKW